VHLPIVGGIAAMLVRYVLLVIFFFAVFSILNGPAHAERRVALVIGNSAYSAVAKLPTPTNDAKSVAELFRRAGFDSVELKQDLTKLEFLRALREFADTARGADVAVVFYAGHGIHVRDINYMIPVDARSRIDAEVEAVSLDRIVEAIVPAKRLRLVILDACRPNAFAPPMRRDATRSLPLGLGKAEPTMGETLIAYAAKSGTTAEDGVGANSLYTTALITHLGVRGLDIRLAFGRIRDEVLKRTANRQEPFVYGSLSGESRPLVPSSSQPDPQLLAGAKGDYELVEKIGTKTAWEVFLGSHKVGPLVELARAKLDASAAGAREPPRTQSPPTPPVVTAPSLREPPRTQSPPIPPVPIDQDDPLRRGHALLIANATYRDSRWPRLDDVPLQVTALQKGLKDHFDTVEVVQDFETEALRQKINGFLRHHGNDGNARLLIYYAGHGYTELIAQRNSYRGYITGIDTPAIDTSKPDYNAARLRAISMTEIRATLEDVLAKHVLFIFDSCFAGTIFTSRGSNDPPRPLTKDLVARLLEKPARDFITAGTAEQRVPAHSPIPDLLLAALNGDADRYRHGVISSAEIHAYLLDRVLQMQNVNLTPQQGRLPDPVFAQGSFLFRVNTSGTRTP
jgi:uncharacterized caspase-like protein